MSRTAQVFLVIAGVLLSTGLTVYYVAQTSTPPSSPDVRPLLLAAVVFAVLAYAIDSSFVRSVTYHWESLRPPYQETQRHLSRVAGEGKELLARLNGYKAVDDDKAAEAFWYEEVQRWTNWADGIISWRSPSPTGQLRQ